MLLQSKDTLQTMVPDHMRQQVRADVAAGTINLNHIPVLEVDKGGNISPTILWTSSPVAAKQRRKVSTRRRD